MKYFLFLLLLFSYPSFSEVLKDDEIEFSIDIPASIPIYTERDHRGKSVTLSFEDRENNEIVIFQAVRANNGGYVLDKMTFFKQMLEGMSSKYGTKASEPRTISYKGHEIFVATHVGINENKDATATTISYFEDNGSWRKVITVQLLSGKKQSMLDKDIIKNLQLLEYEPTLP